VETSILFLRKNEDRKEQAQSNSVRFFMPQEIGYERKTKHAKSIGRNDFLDIVYIMEGKESKNDALMVESCLDSELGSRLDASYYFWKTCYPLPVNGLRMEDISEIKNRKIKDNDAGFEYIEYSSISSPFKTIMSTDFFSDTSTAPSRAKRLVLSGDILLARLKNSSSSMALVPDYLNESVASSGFLIISSEKYKYFMLYLLQTKSVQEQVSLLCTGSVMPSISDYDFSKIVFRMPSKSEIKRIATDMSKVECKKQEIREYYQKLSTKDLMEEKILARITKTG